MYGIQAPGSSHTDIGGAEATCPTVLQKQEWPVHIKQSPCCQPNAQGSESIGCIVSYFEERLQENKGVSLNPRGRFAKRGPLQKGTH